MAIVASTTIEFQAADLPVESGPAVNVATVEGMLAHLDAHSAEYRDRGNGWFEARWYEPSVGLTWRFATNATEHPEEADFARAFERRALNS